MSTNDLWTTYAHADQEEQIIAAAEVILRKRLERKGKIADPSEATRYLRAHCGGLEHEVFGVLFLDTRHHIIAIEDMFRGTVDGAEIHPREVVKASMKHNAAALIIFHNHPSGNPEPSAADRAVTARLKQALTLVDVRLIDHFVITCDECVSLAARGWV